LLKLQTDFLIFALSDIGDSNIFKGQLLLFKYFIGMNKIVMYFLAALLAFSAVSCVSGKKFKTLQDTSKQFMNERDDFKTQNIGLEMSNKELTAKLASLQKKAETVSDEILKAQSERDKAIDDFNKISIRYK